MATAPALAEELASEVLRALGNEGVAVGGLQPVGGGLGLASSEGCSKGAELLRLPLNHCLTSRAKDAPKKLQPLLDAAQKAGQDGLQTVLPLCARLWHEHLALPAAHAAWLQLLRAQVSADQSALHWDEETVSKCGPLSAVPHLLQVAREQVSKLMELLATLASQFPDKLPRPPCLEEVEWLYGVCSSRALTLQVGGEPFQVLAPAVDLVRQSFVEPAIDQAPFLELEGQDLILRATADLSAGGEIRGLYYGPASNDDLVVDAGMASIENPYHQVLLSLSFEILRSAQVEALKKHGLDRFLRAGRPGRTAVSIMLRQSDPFPNVAIVLCRILTGSEASEQLLHSASESTAEMDRKWVFKLLEVIKAQMQLYPQRATSDHLADVLYLSTRGVLKAAVAKLLALSQQAVQVE